MKDAKGHGSNGRNYARQAPTKNGRARMYGTSMADRIKIAQDQQNIKEGRSAGTPGNPLGRADAASELASGPKSAAVPVHDAFSSAAVHGSPERLAQDLSDEYRAKHGWDGDVGKHNGG